MVDENTQADLEDEGGDSEGLDAGIPSDAPPEDFGPPERVPVELNDRAYDSLRAEHGDEVAAALQRQWGDEGLSNAAISDALGEDHPVLNAIYDDAQTPDGALSLEGQERGLQYLIKNWPGEKFRSPEELETAHPELAHIWYDHADDAGNLSPAGMFLMRAYVAKALGYKHAYRAQRR